MVIGDDEVESETARGFCFGKGAHAGVDGDDEAHAFCVCRFNHTGLETIALAETVRHVKPSFAAQHFNGGLEQDYGGGAVYVVVAVEKDGLVVCDRRLKSICGGCHAEHEEWIVKEGWLWVEEGMRLSCGGDAAGEEQFRKDQRQASLSGEVLCFFAMRLGYEPTLRWPRKGGLDGLGMRSDRIACGTCRSEWAGHRSLLVLVVTMGVVDDDVLETFDILEQRLVAFIPLSCGFVQEDESLIDKAKLDVTDHAGVFAEPLRFDEFSGFFIREVHFAGFFDEGIKLFAFEGHFTEGDEGSADVLGHLDKVFPCVGVAAALPDNGGYVLSDVTREAVHSVTFNEGHHVVFQR